MGLYIILMGVQGAGKGVQAGFISDTYQIPHVSTGDLFRAMKNREDELAKRVQTTLAAGKLVDDDTTNEMVAERLALPDAKNGVILDGYPRNREQSAFLSNYLAERGEQVNAVLLLDLDLYIAFKRTFGRVTDKSVEPNVSYNYYYLPDDVQFSKEDDPSGKFPPRLVATLNGRELSRRNDDADAMSVIERIDIFLEETVRVLEYFRDKGLVYEVDAEQDIPQVSAAIKQIIDKVK
jgi:adenylate kinase